MRSIVAVCLIVLTASSVALAEPEIKGTPTELSNYLIDVPKLVVLSGTSELKVQAESAIVMISVNTESGSLHTALKSNQDLRKQIIGILNKSGISPDKIVASRFSSTPQYGLFGKKPSSYISKKDFEKALKDYEKKGVRRLRLNVSEREGLQERIKTARKDMVFQRQIYEGQKKEIEKKKQSKTIQNLLEGIFKKTPQKEASQQDESIKNIEDYRKRISERASAQKKQFKKAA